MRTEEVTITIEDVDDNEPQFNSKSYDAIVAENTPNGVPIILSSTMRVEDIDQVNLVFGTCLKKKLNHYLRNYLKLSYSLIKLYLSSLTASIVW